MHPELIDFGKYQLHTYGLMMFLAFASAIFVASKREKKYNLPSGTVLDFSNVIIISGLAGARLLYVLTHLEEFRGHWIDTFNPFQSDGTIGIAGLVLLGGVILSTVSVIFYTWLKNIPILKMMDLFSIPLALGIAIGRLGCFFNGCCFGLPTDLPWGVVFPEGCSASWVMADQHIHPTQLYAFTYNIIIFAALILLEKRYKNFEGFTVSVFFTFYGLFRFINETLRWHEESLHMVEWSDGFLTISQIVSLTLMLAGVITFMVLRYLKISEKRSLS